MRRAVYQRAEGLCHQCRASRWLATVPTASSYFRNLELGTPIAITLSAAPAGKLANAVEASAPVLELRNDFRDRCDTDLAKAVDRFLQ